MRILHIGDSNNSFTRIINLLENEKLTKLIIFSPKGNNLYDRIYNSCEDDVLFNENKNKLVEYKYNLPIFYTYLEKLFIKTTKFGLKNSIIRKITFYIHPFFTFLLKLIDFKELDEVIQKENPDIIWSGSNNFDLSNLLTWLIGVKTNLKIVRSYKETNGKKCLDEYMSLLHSDKIVLPNNATLEHFKLIYKNINWPNKIISFADEDWRYSRLIENIKNNSCNKLSYYDNMPHIVILSGKVTFGEYDNYTNGRYNYLNLIQSLIKNKVHVHLHCLNIYNSETNSIVNTNVNPYSELQINSEYFHIEQPLNLEHSSVNYLTLKKYDAGILHNYIEGEEISIFSKFNVPNRLYEYQISDVMPIVIKGTLNEVEKIIEETNFGIIAQSYDKACEMLKNLITDKIQVESFKMNNFIDFSNIILKKIV